MAENMMCENHKSTNDKYRDNYVRIFTGLGEVYCNLAEAIKACDGTGKTIFVSPTCPYCDDQQGGCAECRTDNRPYKSILDFTF